MIINSVLPPVCIQSVVDGCWYIVTTDSKLGWVKVNRRYDWEELSKMWNKRTFENVKQKPIKSNYKVEGSRGNTYNVVNNDGVWNCSCPAFGWGRGKDCKHIIQLKNKK
jgi:hypothetical protein